MVTAVDFVVSERFFADFAFSGWFERDFLEGEERCGAEWGESPLDFDLPALIGDIGRVVDVKEVERIGFDDKCFGLVGLGRLATDSKRFGWGCSKASQWDLGRGC